ncbi:unnamed protein product [Schistocephalus solidus]|uniref:RNase H domain-containing protein n=1 Tax=Schistocephalus solidus TaxID=70667 RepID=A0A183SV49_SCHSO|nr:unnamed protein product [Schistocephalus solidus]
MDYIFQFTSNIHHIGWSRNEVADALSWSSIAHLQLFPEIDFMEMTAEERRVGSTCNGSVSGLQLQDRPLNTGNSTILCKFSSPSHRLFVPSSVRPTVLPSLHNLFHPGSRAAEKT